MSRSHRSAAPALLLLLLGLSLPYRASSASISFQNCLPESILVSKTTQLQFTPYHVDAAFDTQNPSHGLNLTIWGNVKGQQNLGDLPPPDSPYWTNPNETNGKIPVTGSDNKYTTLSYLYQVLTYTSFQNKTQFCLSLENGSCPLAPAFGVGPDDLAHLPAIFLQHDFESSYAFGSIVPTIKVISGDEGAKDIACISATITPDLGSSISNLLTWLPAAILILKGLATISAAIWSPWGSSDIFRWSSNYGRDEDLLRLVTPGFGDCLQYIQFVVLTGALRLRYPGFYQPAVSQASWSLLMFNESFVSHGNGTQSLVDGIYTANATYGMTRMSQLVGMTTAYDIWACMVVWLLVIAGAVVVLCQLGFVGRALYRSATHTSEEDLRRKNLPFTLGHINRLLFNYFILPIVSISLFQLVIAPHSPSSVIAGAVILLAIMIIAAGWILRVIFVTKPRTLLFDDMPIVLLYGPLYNTYSDSAAPFALIPVFITFIRGVAIGAVQPSGIAQVIILAVCEVILILTLNGFRPFQGQTSMNLYHTAFAAVRLVTILLMIAFVPSLGVTEGPKGWIGYVILLLHACVLVFGFFLNAAQTLIEVIARGFGAGGHGVAIRGSMLSWRMLKKRQNRHTKARLAPDADRHSMMSSAAILSHAASDHPANFGGRSRSISASSNQLLNRHSGFENFSNAGEPMPPLGSPGEHPDYDYYSYHSGAAGSKPPFGPRNDTGEFYRPPRPRKGTLDAISYPGNRTRKTTRGSSSGGGGAVVGAGAILAGTAVAGSGDFPYQDSPGSAFGAHARNESYDSDRGSPARGSSARGAGVGAPAFLRDRHDSNESVGLGVLAGRERTDYAVREVDQYYRGAALNDQPTRKLKTGPADPQGPAVTAQTWFQRLRFGLQGKKKDASKGFEVVRSARAPPPMEEVGEGVEMEMQSPPNVREEYRDEVGSPEIGSGEDAERGREGERGVSGGSVAFSSPMVGSDEEDFVKIPSNSGGFDFGLDAPAPGDGSGVDVPETSAGAAAPKPRPDSETVARPFAALAATVGGSASNPAASRAEEVPSLGPVETGEAFRFPSRFNSRASTVGIPTTTTTREGAARGREDGYTDLSSSPDGQDWLRAVDNLHRFRDSALLVDDDEGALSSARSPQTQSQQQVLSSVVHSTLEAPDIPRKSSRRGSSQNHSPARRLSGALIGDVPIPTPGGPSSAPAPHTGAHAPAPTTPAAIPPESQTQDIFDGFDSSPGSPSAAPLLVRVASEEEEEDDATHGAGLRRTVADALPSTATTSDVHRHRAADSITRNSFGAEAALRGARAEILGEEEGRD